MVVRSVNPWGSSSGEVVGYKYLIIAIAASVVGEFEARFLSSRTRRREIEEVKWRVSGKRSWSSVYERLLKSLQNIGSML